MSASPGRDGRGRVAFRWLPMGTKCAARACCPHAHHPLGVLRRPRLPNRCNSEMPTWRDFSGNAPGPVGFPQPEAIRRRLSYHPMRPCPAVGPTSDLDRAAFGGSPASHLMRCVLLRYYPSWRSVSSRITLYPLTVRERETMQRQQFVQT